MARRLHAVTKKYNVPLLINDRIDVALAVGCEGVHIGQDDLGMLCIDRYVALRYDIANMLKTYKLQGDF